MRRLRSQKVTIDTIEKNCGRKKRGDNAKIKRKYRRTLMQPTAPTQDLGTVGDSQAILASQDIEFIDAEQGDYDMLQLAYEAEARMTPEERAVSRCSWPMSVPGRLSLTAGKRTYDVSREELRRRISPPENLSTSLICQLLKRSRSKHNLPDGLIIKKFQKPSVSLFTGLTEGETKDLADDFEDIVRNTRLFKVAGVDKVCSEEEINVVGEVLLKVIEKLEKVSKTEESSIRTHGFSVPITICILKELVKSL